MNKDIKEVQSQKREKKTGKKPEVQKQKKPQASSEVIRQKIIHLIDEQLSSQQFLTKEEFIRYLIDEKKLEPAAEKPNDGGIHLKGKLEIDDRVASGLDWSDVVVDQAVIKKGKVTAYHFLPMTRRGLVTDLQPLNAEDFIRHNMYDAKISKNSVWYDGDLRLPEFKQMPDLSQITAKRVFCAQNKVSLRLLPKAAEGYWGLNSSNLEIDCKNPAAVARKKGFSRAVCKQLGKDEGLLQRLIGGLTRRSGDPQSNH